MKISIGTICEIKNSNIKVMVIGCNKKVSQTLEHTFEYVGCLYPEGYTSVEKLCFFDGVHIEKVIFRGYDENREKILMLKKHYIHLIKMVFNCRLNLIIVKKAII